jgi:hypothetical protein
MIVRPPSPIAWRASLTQRARSWSLAITSGLDRLDDDIQCQKITPLSVQGAKRILVPATIQGYLTVSGSRLAP